MPSHTSYPRPADRCANLFRLSYLTSTFQKHTYSECGSLLFCFARVTQLFIKVLYGQSLGGAVAVDLASRNSDKVVLEMVI